MIVLVGLVILLAAALVATAGVLGNSGSTDAVTGHFTVLGYHVTGSTGTLFLYGVAVGAIGVCGLFLLLGGARRNARRGRVARRELKHSLQDSASLSRDRDELLAERESRPSETLAATGPATDAVGRSS